MAARSVSFMLLTVSVLVALQKALSADHPNIVILLADDVRDIHNSSIASS